MLRIRMPDSAIRPRIALKPKGWWKTSSVGTAPTRPSGAVANTMTMVVNERTCSMMTVRVTISISGKTVTSAVIAFSLSSTEPAVSIR